MEYENMAEDSNSQDPSKNDDELEEYSANLIEAIQNGAVLKDVQCVSNGTMNDIYKIAYEFYHIGRLDDAISLFRFYVSMIFIIPNMPWASQQFII